jgi:hypothetical protein
LAVVSLSPSAAAAASHSATLARPEVQLPDVCSAKPASYFPTGHEMLQRVAPASLPRPTGHAVQTLP